MAEAEGGGPAEGTACGAPVCPLCLRPIPPEARQSRHHLTPKLRGGKQGPTALLHQICHNEIHASLTEAELARSFADFDSLRSHPRLARFVAWITTKPPAYHGRSLGSVRRRRRKNG